MSTVSLPTWEQIFNQAKGEIDRQLIQPAIEREILNVRASWWAVGKSDGEIMAEAKERLIANGTLR